MVAYTSLDNIPIYNFIRCQNGDFYFIEVMEAHEYDSEKQKAEHEAAFMKLESNYEGKISVEAQRLGEKYNLIRQMQAVNQLIQQTVLLHTVAKYDKESKENLKAIQREAASVGLKNTSPKSFELNNKKIQRHIDEIQNRPQKETKTSISDLFKSIGNIAQIININVDPMKCVASQYYAYVELCNDKITALEAQKNGKRL